MKLLLFPLVILMFIAFLNMAGMGAPSAIHTTGQFSAYGHNAENGWFDANGHQVAYANGTPTDNTEGGRIEQIIIPGANPQPFYHNVTFEYNVYTATGEKMVVDQSIQFDIGTSLGLIGIVAAGIVLAGVVGARIFGSGVSEESVSAIWKGTLLLTIWGVFSVISIGLITAMPYVGVFLYMFLTAVYCFGVINQVGHPGED